MKTTITFRHMKTSPALKTHVNEKLEKLDRYTRNNMEAHVVLSVEKSRQNVEVLISSKGLRAQGTSSSEDMYVSIDDAMDKVEKTLRRHHDKKIKQKTHVVKGEKLA